MVDDADQNVVQVVNLLLSPVQSLQVFGEAALGQLQLVVLVPHFLECLLQLLDLPLGKVELLLSLLNVGDHIRVRLVDLLQELLLQLVVVFQLLNLLFVGKDLLLESLILALLALQSIG